MKQDYLKLMEEHRTSDKINLFEKVLVTAQRAKSLYELDEPSKAAFQHKPTFQAILETNEGKIRLTHKKAEIPSTPEDTD